MSKLLKSQHDKLVVTMEHYAGAFPFPCPECHKPVITWTRLKQVYCKKDKREEMLCNECARKMFLKILLDTTPESNK